jgi:hypothetical protein
MIPNTHVSINMCMLIFLSRVTPTATHWFLKKRSMVANHSSDAMAAAASSQE